MNYVTVLNVSAVSLQQTLNSYSSKGYRLHTCIRSLQIVDKNVYPIPEYDLIFESEESL